METVLENIRQGLNHPSHRHKRVRGCMSLFVAGVTIFAQYGPLAPSGERVRVRGKAPTLPQPAPVGPGNYSYSQPG
ncbi:hypothetical protein CBL23_04350 [Shigella sonnei]|nr:hypothetical protein CBL23_04350 [Shigella sonnei]